MAKGGHRLGVINLFVTWLQILCLKIPAGGRRREFVESGCLNHFREGFFNNAAVMLLVWSFYFEPVPHMSDMLCCQAAVCLVSYYTCTALALELAVRSKHLRIVVKSEPV